MSTWQVHVAYGWDDQKPPEVQEIIDLHGNQGKLAVLQYRADKHGEEFQGYGDSVCYDQSKDVEIIGNVFQTLGSYLSTMQCKDVDVTSLIFMNFQPKTFSMSPRPEPFRVEVPTFFEGLQRFLQAVVGSIQGVELWSICEWAMITCTRRIELRN